MTVFCELLIIAVFLLEKEIDKANKAVQRFEIESEHLGDKETQKNEGNRPGKQLPITMRHIIRSAEMYNVRCPVGLMHTEFIIEKALDKYTHWVYNRVDERRNINKWRLDMKNYFEVKKNIVLTGNSRIFNNWAEHSSITADDFIAALEWVCDDPLDANGMLTREIALAPDGIVKLRRINDHRTGITSFYKFEGDNGGEKGKLGTIWGGEIFDDGFMRKISLSAKDRV